MKHAKAVARAVAGVVEVAAGAAVEAVVVAAAAVAAAVAELKPTNVRPNCQLKTPDPLKGSMTRHEGSGNRPTRLSC
jgi:hypothetical protein